MQHANSKDTAPILAALQHATLRHRHRIDRPQIVFSAIEPRWGENAEQCAKGVPTSVTQYAGTRTNVQYVSTYVRTRRSVYTLLVRKTSKRRIGCISRSRAWIQTIRLALESLFKGLSISLIVCSSTRSREEPGWGAVAAHSARVRSHGTSIHNSHNKSFDS